MEDKRSVSERGKSSTTPARHDLRRRFALQQQSVESPVQLLFLLLQKMKVTGGVAGVQDVLQGTFDAHKTCGNGACAIHSVFGVPDQSGEYFCEQARQLFSDSLGVADSDFQ